MRSVYIDLGANVGETLLEHASNNADDELYAFELDQTLFPQILNRLKHIHKPVNLVWAAAWTHDGMVDFFQSGISVASTVVQGKIEHGDWPQIDYSSPTAVPSLDFSKWLKNNFAKDDYVFIKMDIEGGEYAVLEKMIIDGSIHLVKKLRCEWHQDRYPDVSKEKHDQLRNIVGRIVELEDWI